MKPTLAAVLMAALLACPAGAASEDFYAAAPHELHGRAGSLIKAEPITPPPGAASAYRLLYRSTGLKGESVAVSGVVAIPAAGTAGDRPVVSWAHPTAGIADACAPSKRADVFERVPGIANLLGQGVIVVGTDYAGLGTDGVHPYLIGPSEGHAVLDAARAVRTLPDAGAGSRLVVSGYSQGGHAALWAGKLARSYAPDLHLVGIAAIAPPTELGTILRADLGGRAGKVLSAFALSSWSQLYDIPVDSVLKDKVELVLGRVAKDCTETFQDTLRVIADEAPFEREGFLDADVTVTQPWRGLIESNTPAVTPADVPVLIAQGAADSIVQPLVTSLYMDELCAHGVPVEFVLEPRAEHTDMPARSADAVTDWIARRLAGAPARTDCKAR
ncbi:MAG TPA: lipase family protein [Xanthobacteraceae bacterium]|nr:lipase family protein [Xanthobacteraceae bacterium]